MKVLHEHREHKGICLHRVEDDNGHQGWMIRIATPGARLSPKGQYKYTCPYCGRYIKARGQRCRDCIGDALAENPRWQWARNEITHKAALKTSRQKNLNDIAQADDIETELIKTIALI